MDATSIIPTANHSDGQTDAAGVIAAVDALCTRHTTPCGDGHLVWRRWGEGQPVVLLHGGAGSWMHWMRNIEALSARHTVWALDMPGYGDSAPPDPLSIDAIADTIESGLRTLIPGEQPVDLVAFSFGAAIATMIAARLEHRLRNLVVLGARFAKFSSRPPLSLVKWRGVEDPASRLAAHRSNLGMSMIANSANIDALAVQVQSNSERARISPRRWKPHAADRLHEYFPLVHPRGRVAAVFGSLDSGAHSIIENGGSQLRAIRPDLDYRVVENAGHWVQYEAAGAVNVILLDILRASTRES